MNELYRNYDYETDEGRGTTTPIERLARENARYLKMGAGQECPRCHQHMAMFFGDPDGEHWCIACQILDDAQRTIAASVALEGGQE